MSDSTSLLDQMQASLERVKTPEQRLTEKLQAAYEAERAMVGQPVRLPLWPSSPLRPLATLLTSRGWDKMPVEYIRAQFAAVGHSRTTPVVWPGELSGPAAVQRFEAWLQRSKRGGPLAQTTTTGATDDQKLVERVRHDIYQVRTLVEIAERRAPPAFSLEQARAGREADARAQAAAAVAARRRRVSDAVRSVSARLSPQFLAAYVWAAHDAGAVQGALLGMGHQDARVLPCGGDAPAGAASAAGHGGDEPGRTRSAHPSRACDRAAADVPDLTWLTPEALFYLRQVAGAWGRSDAAGGGAEGLRGRGRWCSEAVREVRSELLRQPRQGGTQCGGEADGER